MEKPRLNLPEVELRVRTNDKGSLEVFDPLRRKYVALEPEEYVRQHFVNYLVNFLGYPSSHIANEVGLTLNNTRRRCDTLVYDRMGQPLMIVEYKAPGISIDQNVFDQIVRYNMVLRARYLVVSNGMNHYCCVMDYDRNNYHFLPAVPSYSSLTPSSSN